MRFEKVDYEEIKNRLSKEQPVVIYITKKKI